MRRAIHSSVLMVVCAACGLVAIGAEIAKVSWHAEVAQAWQSAQEQGRPMLVFVTRSDCYYCTQMKDHTLQSAAVVGTINQSFVPLVLDGSVATPLLKELNVTSYPCTFVISPQAVVIDRIEGFVPADAMLKRLAAAGPRAGVAKMAKGP